MDRYLEIRRLTPARVIRLTSLLLDPVFDPGAENGLDHACYLL